MVAQAEFSVTGFLENGEGQVVEAPTRGRLVMVVGRAAGQADDVQPFVGGKSSGVCRSGSVLEASQAVRGEAFPPLANRVPVAIQLLGELLVGGRVGRGGLEDKAAAEGQGLGGGTGADQGLELFVEFDREYDTRAKRTWHNLPPCTRRNKDRAARGIMASLDTFVQTLAANL